MVVAGTGSIAYGVNADAVAARSGGWGPVLADEGSGYWIGRRALVAVMRHADGRGPRTALTPLVLEHFGLSRPDDLVNEVYEGAERRQLIASLGQLVEQARAGGDAVAAEILRQAANELVMPPPRSSAGSTCAVTFPDISLRRDVQGHSLAGRRSGGAPGSKWRLAPLLSLLSAEPAVGAVTWLAPKPPAGRGCPFISIQPCPSREHTDFR